MIIDTENKLNQLNDIAKPIFSIFLQRIQAECEVTVRINGVYYSYEDSLKLHQMDNRNPIWNFHEFGIAIDLNIIKDDRLYRKSDIIDDWIKTGVPAIAKELNIRWGGLFNGYPDCVHFDIANQLGENVYEVLNKLKKLGENNLQQLNKLDLSNF